MNKFDRAVEFVLKREGGYVNHPNDPGGETNFGISKRAHPDLDNKNLTVGVAKMIYKQKYWDTAHCQKLPWPLCLVHFDMAVNSGVDYADRFLKKSFFSWERYLLLRMSFYVELAKESKKKRVFFRGWINRLDELYEEATK